MVHYQVWNKTANFRASVSTRPKTCSNECRQVDFENHLSTETCQDSGAPNIFALLLSA